MSRVTVAALNSELLSLAGLLDYDYRVSPCLAFPTPRACYPLVEYYDR